MLFVFLLPLVLVNKDYHRSRSQPSTKRAVVALAAVARQNVLILLQFLQASTYCYSIWRRVYRMMFVRVNLQQNSH